MKRFLKKSLALVLALTMVFGAAPLAGLVGLELPSLKDVFADKAEAATYGYLTYEISNGEVTITACNSSASGDLVIPGSIEGYPVTNIGYKAFYNCTRLTNFTIPNSVTSIGDYAFCACKVLTSVTIPDSVTSIGSGAFYNCAGLTSVTIGNGVLSIGNSAFHSCAGLTSITIPDSVTSIGSQAFYNCYGLTRVTIPDSVISIGNYAFYNCTSLASITVDENNPNYSSDEYGVLFNKDKTELIQYPVGNKRTEYKISDSVTSIGNYAFNKCTGLTRVTISDSVTSIGNYAFYNCTGLTNITIGNGVTSIGNSAFYNCTGLTSVTIGNGVTSIGSGAFKSCTGLTSVIIPDSVTSIGSDAFESCTGLTSITIPDSIISIGNNAFYKTGIYNDSSNWENGVLYIGNYLIKVKDTTSSDYSIKSGTKVIADYAFSDCDWLTSVTIPDSVTSIGWYAFDGCTGLTNVTIGNSVTSIGGWAFYDCDGLTSVTIPNSVTSIGGSAFSGCAGLTSVTIGNGVTSIGGWAFYDCDGLTSVTIPNSVTSIGGSAFSGCAGLTSVTIGNGVTSIGGSAFSGCAGLTSVVIPNGVTSIESSTFEGCTELTSVTIPDSVTSIGDRAFYCCDGLTSITIPDGVTSIGSYAFYKCTGLTGVTIPNSVTSIGGSAFSGCAGLTSVTIGNGVTSIGYGAFYECTGLTSVVIPNGVTSIESSTFEGCTKLTSITIPNSVTSIGEDAFYNCTGLTSITIPDSVTSIGNYAFWGCKKLTSITIPNSVTSIGDAAFTDCEGLTSVTIPDSVTSIGDSAFSDCTGLTSVTIPNSVTTIGDSAFSCCDGLTSVTIPDSVTSIGDYAFDYCTGLTNVTIGNSVTSIGYREFWGCTRLTSITIPDSVTSIDRDAFSNTGIYNDSSNWENGVLYIGNYLIKVKDTTSSDYSIKSGTKVIADYAFFDCDWLTSITIPDSVTSIGNSVFCGCDGLTSVTIGNSVTSIGDAAFSDCTGLTSVTIPNSVTSIGDRAFYCCDGLTSITIPNSVTSIGNYAFYKCTGLTRVTISDSVTSIGNYAFYNCTGLTNITVDENNQYYSNDDYGVLFNKDKTELIQYPVGNKRTEYIIPDGVTSIGSGAFYNCAGLTSITIPDSVTSIDRDAFYLCYRLTSVTIPNSVTSIGYSAFYYCTGLTSITIPDSVTSIGGYAFYNCTSLTDVYYAGTEDEWKAITIGSNNKHLINATIHYNSVPAGSSDELKLNREAMTISNNVCPVITVTEYPEGVKAEDLVWSSSNSEVASINSENVVTPNHYGKTEIKVETKDGKYSATCELTVEASFVITSDSSSVKSIRRGDTAEYRIYFYNCEAEELPVDEVELSIIDGGALQLISYGIIDNYLYVNIKGVSEGAGVIEVYSDNPLAYNKFKISVYPENIDWRADKVPNYTKKNTENFRRSSFIVENYNYIYDENTETYTVSMDVYNMAGDYPVLAAYNSSGKMVDFDVAERFVEMPGDWESFFGTLGFGAVQMVTGDLFTYRAVTNSKKTTVSVKVPADGYITISNDITASPAAAIVNLGGLMIEIASLTCNLSEEDSEKNKDVTKEFVKSLKEKLPDSDEFLYDLIEKFTEKVAKKTTRDYVIGITQFSQDALYELCNEAGSSFAELAGDAFKSVLKKDVKALITKSAMEKLIKEDMVDATVLSKLKVAEMLFKAGNLLGLVDYALNALKFNNGSGITTIQFNPCGENGFVCKDTIKIVSNVIDEDTVLQHFIIKDAGKLAITKQELQIDPKDIVELHEIALIKNGNKVEGVEFKATVEMDIPKTMFAPTVKVFRIEKDGSYTKLETKVKDGKITFTTDHFSEYVLSGRSIDEAVSGVALNAEAVDIVNKQTYQLVATVSPETASNKSLVWSSGNEKVATVDENGLVSAVSPGTAVITATTVDGGFTASCGITVLPRTFSVTWVVEGVETTSEFNEGEKIIKPDSPIKKGYAFAGWTPEIPETMPSEDISFFAVFECVSGISIKNNTGSKTISYGETLRLTAVATDMPENAKIEWYVDGVKKGEGETFEVSPKNGSIEITVKIVDENGNVLKDKNGNEIQDSEKVSVNSGLWQKIVSFFKNLFGINRTVVQAMFKGIF